MPAFSGPEVVLAVEGGGSLTHAAWQERSGAVARGLVARGVLEADRVALLFDPPAWSDFAVARRAVLQAGGVPVLLSPGASPPDLARALSDSGATALLCPPRLTPGRVAMWAASPDEVAAGHDTSHLGRPARGPAASAELVYPPAPLAPPRPVAVTGAEQVDDVTPEPGGWLVHAWAPGSLAGWHVLRLVEAGRARAATLAAFTPEDLCALVAARRAAVCGLTPALAAAVLASGRARHHDVSSVTRVVLSGLPSAGLRAGLGSAFPGADLVVLDPGHAVATAAAISEATTEAPPVAVSQEGMLWHEQLSPGSFNLPCLARRYEGPMDVAALEWALSEIVRRHQPLRTTFELLGSAPGQVVGDHQGLKLEIVDLGGLPPERRDAEAAALLVDASSRPFDLSVGPLFEPRLVRLGHDDHVLVVRLHHTTFDDWSVDVFRRELSALYTARLAGEPSPLAEPAASFADFCRRERARLSGPPGAAQLAWWKAELAGAPLAVQLPLGDGATAWARPEPNEPLRLDLPAALVADLRALAPRLRATPFMTVLAAFSVLLGRSTGLDDVVIATVVAHRNESGLEPLVGCFTKKVPLRLRLHGDPVFSELVARTRTSLLGALSHQDVAFDAAVSQSLGAPAAAHGAVPQVAVVFQGETPQQVKLAMPGVVTGPFDTGGGSRRERHFSAGPEEERAREDAPVWGDGMYLGTFLILSLLETADGMALVARGVYHRAAAERLLEDFRALLAGVAADPSRRLSQLVPEPAPVAGPPAGVPAGDVVELRGFRARRSRLEAALARCPGVAEVALAVREDAGGEPRLIAYVVPEGGPRPTLSQLRHALWATLPGALWPAGAVVVEAIPRLGDGSPDLTVLPAPEAAGARHGEEPDPQAALVAAIWGEVRGRPAGPDLNYWQEFSFLHALSEARQAGLAITDGHVARSRTPEMLAAAVAASRSG